jgi:predicted O-linked N-acetylglucosamine transferase (SPINDLY family)
MSITFDNIKDKTKVTIELYENTQQELQKNVSINKEINDKYVQCLQYSSEIIRFCDELNPFQINRLKDIIMKIYYINAEILSRTVGLHMNRSEFTQNEKGILYTCITHLQKSLNIDPFHNQARELYKIIFIYLTIFNSNVEENVKLLRNVLMVDPCDYQLHYNLGFMYHRMNDLENSLYHYKLAVGLIENQIKIQPLLTDSLKQFKIKCLNGLGSIYFSIQDRELANYYFYKALEISPEDPDINNQIGVIYTELRFTDKAIFHYKQGIKNAEKAHISTDIKMLLASMYMNMGLAYCYEINYPEAINCYNKALEYKPMLSLAYQNKLLDLNYISHLIEDPMYITKLHKNINKIYPYVCNDYKISLPNYQIKKITNKSDIKKQITDINLQLTNAIIEPDYKKEIQSEQSKIKLNIGFVSGDFICHPVSYFVSCILKYIDYDIFNVYCYSLKMVSLTDLYPKCNWRVVKGTNPEQLKQKIVDDSIDILFDLSSQTGDNRLDTFVLKPAPIQISYCGYPNTSGLSNMDYHIVDHYCDSDGITPGPGNIVRPSTQKYYSEKLIFMDNCFLSYTSSLPELPELIDTQPCIKNKYLTIGSFNRYNKINDDVIEVWEEILETCPNVKFIIKTKEFLTEKLHDQFIKTWKNKKLLNRIKILDYADLYDGHLKDYNLMDIALDTFPYSGTTTSCEALMMGVPILTLFDNERQYHSHNVTSSLMINCGLEEYVVFSKKEYVNKIKELSENLDKLNCLKQNVREFFTKGPICNYKMFVNEFEDKLIDTYKNHFKLIKK